MDILALHLGEAAEREFESMESRWARSTRGGGRLLAAKEGIEVEIWGNRGWNRKGEI